MTLVLFSHNLNPLDFPIYNSLICHISHTYYYIHDGAGQDSKRTFTNGIDKNISANIVRVDGIDFGNLFSFALSIYYQANYTAIFDVDKMLRSNISFSDDLIDKSIKKLINDEAEAIFFKTTDPYAVISHQYVIRHFTVYTDIKYSNTSALNILYKTVYCTNKFKYVALSNNFQNLQTNFSSCDQIPSSFKCELDASDDGKYAVLLPTYKRNYIARSITEWQSQTHKPSQIIVFQNKMLTLFDFAHLNNITGIPIRHFWCTNWNSLFFLTYCSMMFLHEKYFVKIDDDIFMQSSLTGSKMYKCISHNPNVMAGMKGFQNSGDVSCGCNVTKRYFRNEFDYFAWLVMMYSSSGKILHRFAPLTYYHGEDAAIAYLNSVECGTKSKVVPSATFVNIGWTDRKGHSYEEEFKNYTNVDMIWKKTVCYYLHHGYHPPLWSNYKCNEEIKSIDDIRFKYME